MTSHTQSESQKIKTQAHTHTQNSKPNKKWQPEKDFNLIIFERTIISGEYGNGLNRVSWSEK